MTQRILFAPARIRLPQRFLAGVVLTFALALGFFYWLMRPSMFELQAMALFLAITAGISVLAGFIAYRLGWIYRTPHISWALMGSYALAGALTFLNVWVTARLMFASKHDLMLATVLLVFAGGIAMSLGYFLSAALNRQITDLAEGAKAIAEGDLDARVPVYGRNELAELARIFNDMAARLKAADQKQRELDAMRRNLVAWAGHDLRTPLASIQAMIEALADGVVTDPSTVQRYLDTSRRDIQALSHLIDDLFDLAQFDAGALELDRHPTLMADLVSDTIERFSGLAEQRKIRLEGRVAANVARVNIDAQKVERVLANLIGNALRHTPAGGEVAVRVERVAEGVQVEVRDAGEGIHPDDLPYVFDQFYRGEKSRSRATGGSGLGLAIAKRIVEAHGGEIMVESAPGEGAVFRFTLP
ncbi:MAG: cell wall metabolism sensor histidine kinase WalK [Chloroflexi bacterium]|nr:cell wall metabolism sensor histidine kinase WalK [Chloroflexota bacterium]